MKIVEIITRLLRALKDKGLNHVVKVSIDVVGGNLHNSSWYSYGRFFNKMVVHVIGDSRVRVFKGEKRFVIHHIGPATAFNLSKKQSTTMSNEKFWKIVDHLVVERKDKILMVFGEIDSRIHIYKAYKKRESGKSIKDVIYQTILRYDETLSRLFERGFDFYVYGIPPGSKEGNTYNVPHYPPPGIRADINKLFHEMLEKYCENKGYKLYTHYVDRGGFIKDEYKFDRIHLNKKIIPAIKKSINFV